MVQSLCTFVHQQLVGNLLVLVVVYAKHCNLLKNYCILLRELLKMMCLLLKSEKLISYKLYKNNLFQIFTIY